MTYRRAVIKLSSHVSCRFIELEMKINIPNFIGIVFGITLNSTHAIAEIITLHCGSALHETSPYQQLMELHDSWQILDVSDSIYKFNQQLNVQYNGSLSHHLPQETTWKKREKTFVRSINFLDGSSYEGAVQFGKLHGEGRFYTSHGEKYIGRFENGSFTGNGFVVLKKPNGEKYVGDVRDFDANGDGSYYSNTGVSVVGNFASGRLNGTGSIQMRDSAYLEGDFADGLASGTATFVTASGTRITSDNWVRGQILGYAEINYSTGAEYSGEVRGLNKSGTGVFVSETGNTYTSDDWYCDIIRGYGTILYKDGRRYEGEIAEGNTKSSLQKNGKGTVYLEDGGYISGNFVNGSLNGFGKWYSKGIKSLPFEFIYEGNWVNNRWDGEGTLSSVDGNLFYQGEFYGVINGYGAVKEKVDDSFLGNDAHYTYSGEWKKSQRTGQGEYVERGMLGTYSEKGSFKNKLLHGVGDVELNGRQVTASHFVNLDRLLPGVASEATLNPIITEAGTYKDGKPISVKRIWSGNLKSEYSVESDMSVGELSDLEVLKVIHEDKESLFWGRFEGFALHEPQVASNGYAFTGFADIHYADGSRYLGYIQRDKKQGLGVYRGSEHHNRDLVSLGMWQNDSFTGDGFQINLITEKVTRCNTSSSTKTVCKDNSIIEWFFPIRQIFGFADYGMPKLKRLIDAFSREQLSEAHLQTWGLDTLVEILVRGIVVAGDKSFQDPSALKTILKDHEWSSIHKHQIQRSSDFYAKK